MRTLPRCGQSEKVLSEPTLALKSVNKPSVGPRRDVMPNFRDHGLEKMGRARAVNVPIDAFQRKKIAERDAICQLVSMRVEEVEDIEAPLGSMKTPLTRYLVILTISESQTAGFLYDCAAAIGFNHVGSKPRFR